VLVEPDANNQINRYAITFKTDELNRVRKLLAAMWQHVQTLTLPDTNA
jgi:hypothetical protein